MYHPHSSSLMKRKRAFRFLSALNKRRMFLVSPSFRELRTDTPGDLPAMRRESAGDLVHQDVCTVEAIDVTFAEGQEGQESEHA